MNKTLGVAGALSLSSMLGCGTGVQEALLLAAESGGRTLLDVWISDLYSGLPDLFSLPPGPGEPVGDDGTDGGTGDGGTGDGATGGDGTGGDGGTGDGGGTGGDGGGGDLVGDAEMGQLLYTANSCALCHCEDASGGCLPGAPNIQGKDFATIEERLQGETPHPGGKFPDLTARDIVDIEAFLTQQTGP